MTVAKILQAENRKDLRNKTMLDKEVFTKQEIKAATKRELAQTQHQRHFRLNESI